MTSQLYTVDVGSMIIQEDQGTLVCGGLGSCIAVVLIGHSNPIGGIAHVMLPDWPSGNRSSDTMRYAGPAVKELIRQFEQRGCPPRRVHTVVAGGANVLKRDDETICQDNIDSVFDCLNDHGLAPDRACVGGTRRRSVRLEVSTGQVLRTLGDQPPEQLYSPNREQSIHSKP